MSVIDILTTVDSICKKYDISDVEKLNSSSVFDNDAFAPLYGLFENVIESALQVWFSFSEVGPVFHMRPLCSVVIQESETRHWHIPLVSKHQFQEDRTWFRIKRMKSSAKQDPA